MPEVTTSSSVNTPLQVEPETPLHAKPDEQLNLSTLRELDEQEIADLDLDPTIDETPSFINIPKELNASGSLPVSRENGLPTTTTTAAINGTLSRTLNGNSSSDVSVTISDNDNERLKRGLPSDDFDEGDDQDTTESEGPLYVSSFHTRPSETTQLYQFDNSDDYKPTINFNSPFQSTPKTSKQPNAAASHSRHSLIRPHIRTDSHRHTHVSSHQPRTFRTRKNSISRTTQHSPQPQHRRLSMSQQSKFISYVDARLMEIQRKFVQSRGLNNVTGYTDLSELLNDVKSLLDFVWYSIDNVANTDYLLKKRDNDDDGIAEEERGRVEVDLEIGDADADSNTDIGIIDEEEVEKEAVETPRRDTRTYQSGGFGQPSYIIKIADDLMDYVEKFKITEADSEAVEKLFKLLFILDSIFKSLIMGSNTGRVKLNGTDKVRFVGIAERTRMRLPLYFETNGIHGYHFELSKIYEQGLESCGC